MQLATYHFIWGKEFHDDRHPRTHCNDIENIPSDETIDSQARLNLKFEFYVSWDKTNIWILTWTVGFVVKKLCSWSSTYTASTSLCSPRSFSHLQRVTSTQGNCEEMNADSLFLEETMDVGAINRWGESWYDNDFLRASTVPASERCFSSP